MKPEASLHLFRIEDSFESAFAGLLICIRQPSKGLPGFGLLSR